ncbi:MAG: glycosyltransferase [Candidatus Rokubacteria bacterium]|nr:glycosyltransferase [Candidatus Rokubacteria bacterium]
MINILFIENSVGLAGSTVSLCTLLNYLDPDVFKAHIVLSRPGQATYLLEHLRRPGDLTVIQPRRSLKQSDVVQRLVDRLGGQRPRLHRLALQTASMLDLFVVTIPYTWRLYQWTKRRKIQLVHQNNGFDLGSLLLARILRVPLVAYQRGDEWNSPAVRRLARGVRRFIANSTTTLKSLTALGIPSGRVSVIYPPLDLETLRTGRSSAVTRETFGVDASSPCFGILGMLLPWKGHAVFLNAAKRVFERIPKARAFVIGAAPQATKEYEAEVRVLARELGIADRVIFTGFRPDVPDMLELLDVVVHASIAPEPFGRVITEAMAMRRPVIAAGAGGPTEIIEDGRTGLLFPPGDAEALADRIIMLLEDPSLAEQIASAGYSDVRRRFSGETHSTLVQHVYETVLRPRSRRSA